MKKCGEQPLLFKALRASLMRNVFLQHCHSWIFIDIATLKQATNLGKPWHFSFEIGEVQSYLPQQRQGLVFFRLRCGRKNRTLPAAAQPRQEPRQEHPDVVQAAVKYVVWVKYIKTDDMHLVLSVIFPSASVDSRSTDRAHVGLLFLPTSQQWECWNSSRSFHSAFCSTSSSPKTR
jgi:hypothetical protein